MLPPEDDVDRIMAIMDAAFDPAFGEAWTRRQVEDSLLTGHCHYIIVAADGQISTDNNPTGSLSQPAGFALSRTGFGEEELLLFAVAPEFRNKGLGAAMLRVLGRTVGERGVARLLLEMRDGNPAESLYRSFGFEPIGRRPKYYRTPDGTRIDAITFACELQ